MDLLQIDYLLIDSLMIDHLQIHLMEELLQFPLIMCWKSLSELKWFQSASVSPHTLTHGLHVGLQTFTFMSSKFSQL